jgi:hypothetical protein
MVRKIKRVMHSLEQGVDIDIALILFQKRLRSKGIYHEHPVQKMIQMNVPGGLLRVNRAPSLRVGKAVSGS